MVIVGNSDTVEGEGPGEAACGYRGGRDTGNFGFFPKKINRVTE
jgi:hypothetical protein